MKAVFVQRWVLVLASLIALSSIGFAEQRVIHRGLGPEPDALEIHQAQGLSAFNVLRDLHEGLLTRDVYGQPVAAIAERWQTSDDGLLWTFTLDSAARWSDGEPITATDFVSGWRYALEPAHASPTAHWLDPVESFQALNAQTFEVRLKKPTPWFEELLTLPVSFPNPAGKRRYSGAFMLDRRVPGSEIRLAANPYYREGNRVWAEQLVWHVTEDPGSELARFRAGELHITETVPPGRYRWLREQLGDQLRVAPYLGSFFLAFNLSREPFVDNLKLRQALSLAIDRELIVERVLGSGELPAWRLVPPGLADWPEVGPPEWASNAEARIERAQALYQQAGYSQDNPLEVELRFNSSLSHRRMAAAVAAMWKQHLGVRSRLVNEEWKVFVTNRRHGRITEIVRGGWIADWSDAGNFLQLFDSDSPLNYSFFADPEFDALIQQATGRFGRERQQLLFEAEQRVLDGQAIIPLYYYVSRHLVHPDVRGYEDNPMDIHLSRWLSLASPETGATR
ncbi:MAG: peptide ABC transporter substrate-binding protein [Pseudomonadota bacterium]